MKINKTEISLLTGSILISLIVACLLWVGRIDHDFFSYYYAGKRIFEGAEMYRDLYGNKGPIFYWFFAGLYGLFRENYGWALVAGNGVLDGITVYVLWRVLEKWSGRKEQAASMAQRLTELVLLLLFYKSFSIGGYRGGIYAENLAMLFLAVSFRSWQKGKLGASALTFGLAALTRQTFVFFVLAFLALAVKEKRLADLWKWGKKLFLMTAVTILIYLPGGKWKQVWNYAIDQNLDYAQTTRRLYWKNFLLRMKIEPKMMTGMVFMGMVGLTTLVADKFSRREKLWMLGLMAASLLATFAGGLFYFHHLSQMIILFGVSADYMSRNKWIKNAGIWLLIVTGLGTLAGYLSYYRAAGLVPMESLTIKAGKINGVDEKKYLTVVPYYAKLYFDYGKNAPDKYYDQYYLSEYFSKESYKRELQQHLALDKDVLNKTIFIMITLNSFDKKIVDDYKKNVVNEFNLVNSGEYRQDGVFAETFVTKEGGE